MTQKDVSMTRAGKISDNKSPSGNTLVLYLSLTLLGLGAQMPPPPPPPPRVFAKYLN